MDSRMNNWKPNDNTGSVCTFTPDPTSERLIIDDDFDIDDSGHGVGPRLGCVGCQEDVRTQVGVSHTLYRHYGLSGPIHTLDCPSCLEELTEAFSL